MTKVSVIVPAHNTEKYIKTCLNSLVHQTLKDIELIVINDHSNDETPKIIEEYEKRYPKKLKKVDLEDEFGVSSARNKGLSIAQGDYIGFVDSDDIPALNMYKQMHDIVNNYDADLGITSFMRALPNKYINLETFRSSKKPIFEVLNTTTNQSYIFDETIACWDKLFKRELIDQAKFLENYIYEDIGFTLPLLLKAKKIIKLDQINYLYRFTPNGIMEKSRTVQENWLDYLEQCLYAYSLCENVEEKKKKVLIKRLNELYMSNIERMINEWNISKKDKEYIANKAYSLYYHYFPSIEHSFNEQYLEDKDYYDAYIHSNKTVRYKTNEQWLEDKEKVLQKIRRLKQTNNINSFEE